MLRILTLLLITALAGQLYTYYPQLPDTLATHFDGQGTANGWMSKKGYAIFTMGLTALLAAIFSFLPYWMRRLPAAWVNVPHKDYWLAEPQRAQTLDFLDKQLSFIGIATITFMIAVTQQVIKANLQAEARLDNTFVWQLVAYMLFVFGMSAYIIWHFYRPPRDGAQL
ncbi:MAG: DUF1648 domain-containing protein [Pseudomonadales bacterium]